MKKRMSFCKCVSVVLVFVVSKFAYAVSFGDFDPRSLAMGGAGVASATSANAAYYNPALLAMFNTRKEVGRNSEFIAPNLTARYVKSLEVIDEVTDDNPDQELADAINAYIAIPNSQNAEVVLQASTDLENNLDELLKGPAHADINAGIILGIGHKHEGGSIIINRRWVGDALIENFENDLQLLNTYIEAMQFIEAGGDPVTAATLYPSIFETNGTLIDQTDNLTFESTGGALQITEIGMSMATKISIANQRFAIGITPKVMQVFTYDFFTDATTGTTNDAEDKNEDWNVNLDIGVAKQIDSQWRAGFVAKNLRKLKYTTSLGNTIELRPQARLGVMHKSDMGLYALDIDLVKNQPVRRGSKSQMLALGGEWRVISNTMLRAGLSKNLAGIDASEKILYTLGVHWDIFNGMLDFTFAKNSVERAAGLQGGIRF